MSCFHFSDCSGDNRDVAEGLYSSEYCVQSVTTLRHEPHPVNQGDKAKQSKSFTKLLSSCCGEVSCYFAPHGRVLSWYMELPRARDQSATQLVFDVTVVGTSLAFGLNIKSSLGAFALDLRWWVLYALGAKAFLTGETLLSN
jgi:hypothetical protein